MQQDSEHISVEFHNRARTVFFSVYDEFLSNSRSIDRIYNEDIYQQNRDRAIGQLRSQMEHIARDIIYKNRTYNYIDTVSQNISQLILQYIGEFIQKTNSL